MAKDTMFRIRIDNEDKVDLEEAAKINKVSASQFARVAIMNRVKKTLSRAKIEEEL